MVLHVGNDYRVVQFSISFNLKEERVYSRNNPTFSVIDLLIGVLIILTNTYTILTEFGPKLMKQNLR